MKSHPDSSGPKEPWRSSTRCWAPTEGPTVRAGRRKAGGQAGRGVAGNARSHPWRRSSGRHERGALRGRSCARARSDASCADRGGLLASVGSPRRGGACGGLPASEACYRARNTRRRAASGCDPCHRTPDRRRRACEPSRGRAVGRARGAHGAQTGATTSARRPHQVFRAETRRGPGKGDPCTASRPPASDHNRLGTGI